MPCDKLTAKAAIAIAMLDYAAKYKVADRQGLEALCVTPACCPCPAACSLWTSTTTVAAAVAAAAAWF
jgi:hypothetical protein